MVTLMKLKIKILEVFGNYYGTLKKTIDEALAQGNARAGEVIQQLGPRIKRH